MVREVVAHSVSLRATTCALGGSGSRGVADVIAIRRSALRQEQCYLCQTKTVSFRRECMSRAGLRSSSGSGPEAARVRALATLKHLHELASRTGALRNFYVFGSFVSAVPAPRDVDVVLIMAENFRLEDCPPESRSLFSHAQAEARYGASIFWVRREGVTDAAMREFLRVWQTKRDGTLRGILEVA
jgi:uncharacterized protein DUF6932